MEDLDHGNYQIGPIPFGELRFLPDEFAQLPSQTKCVVVDNVLALIGNQAANNERVGEILRGLVEKFFSGNAWLFIRRKNLETVGCVCVVFGERCGCEREEGWGPGGWMEVGDSVLTSFFLMGNF